MASRRWLRGTALPSMNILMLHNSYQIRGGEDESFESEVRMLRDEGHFVETIHCHNDQVEAIGILNVALQSIWSRSSHELVDQALRRRSYDVLHVQNFFPLLSPSVYSAARKHGVPVVQTLRNYRLMCPNALFFRDGHICEDCLGKVFKYPGIIHGCYRDSRLATTTVSAMTALHSLKGTWRNDVDLYVCLTEFARQKFIQGGFPPEKIVVKANFVYPDPGCGDGEGGFALFVGRLSPEKGLKTLLSAWDLLELKWTLKLVGEGPLAADVEAFCKQHQNVEWLGPLPSSEVKSLMGSASVLVFPSEWYETFGRVAIESFAKGTPVIASRLGAMAEIVEEMRTGLSFVPGDPEDLAEKLRWVFENPVELQSMREAARRTYEEKYTMQENCGILTRAYESARLVSPGDKNYCSSHQAV
jgi:glycosyltransferase involved in cell wall biosynthesis